MSLNLFNVCAAIPFTKIELLEDGLQDGKHCAGILSPQITARSINIEKRLRIFFLPRQCCQQSIHPSMRGLWNYASCITITIMLLTIVITRWLVNVRLWQQRDVSKVSLWITAQLPPLPLWFHISASGCVKKFQTLSSWLMGRPPSSWLGLIWKNAGGGCGPGGISLNWAKFRH